MWRIIFVAIIVLGIIGAAFAVGFVTGSTMTPLTPENAQAMAVVARG